MEKKLKALTDGQKDLLAALGVRPAEFQEQVQNLLTKKTTQKSDIGRSSPEEAVAALEKREFNLLQWKPVSYSLFKRYSTCRTCGTHEECQDQTEIFLKHIKPRSASNEVLYLPVKQVEYPHLPRRVEISFKSPLVCSNCFERTPWTAPFLKPQVSPQEPTASPQSTASAPCNEPSASSYPGSQLPPKSFMTALAGDGFLPLTLSVLRGLAQSYRTKTTTSSKEEEDSSDLKSSPERTLSLPVSVPDSLSPINEQRLVGDLCLAQD